MGAPRVSGALQKSCAPHGAQLMISKCDGDHPSLTRTLNENCERNYISEVDNRFAVLEKEKNADNTFKTRNISKGTLYT